MPETRLGAHLYLNVSCGGPRTGFECVAGQGDANGYAAALYLYEADLTLEQTAGPAVSNVAGELASAASVRGTSDLAFTATDSGSGVYGVRFVVDGVPVQTSVLDENGGRCRNVGQTTDGTMAFLYLQPCPPSVSVDVPFDTTSLPDGTHHLVVTVLDAAGNEAPVLDRNITVANASAAGGPSGASPSGGGSADATGLNGVGASSQAMLAVSWRSTASERLTVPFGRTEAIVGRLTGPGGAPISGARIEVTATPEAAGASQASLTSPVTGADGTFALTLPPGTSSRSIGFAYRLHTGDALPVTTRTLGLTVHAGMTLSISPRITSVGRSIHFTGRLLGGPVPRSGKLLILEARSPRGPWIEFDVVRSDSRGRYRASYRFKFPGPADYQFRVVSEPESDYPFSAGASRILSVHER